MSVAKNLQSRFFLPRKFILKNSNEIRGLLHKGKRLTGKTVNIFYTTADVRMFAVIMPKKIGNAVQRNKMKRLCREIYRKNPQWFVDKKVIIFAKRFINNYHVLEGEVARLLIGSKFQL